MGRPKIHKEPFIQLTRAQFQLLKKDLRDTAAAGDLPKSWEDIYGEVMSSERVRGNYVTLGSQLRIILEKLQSKHEENKKLLLYNRMLAKAYDKAGSLGIEL